MNSKLKFILETFFFTLVSVGISVTIVFTVYDEEVDRKIAEWQDKPIQPTICFADNTERTRCTISIGNLGIAMGYVHQDYDNVLVVKRVPFAKPPVGDLRFKAPVLERDWSNYDHVDNGGVLDAVGSSQHCWQLFDSSEDSSASEDCLYLDIYIPRAALDGNLKDLPVFLYFHGGAYLLGMNSVIRGEHIAATQNIIVIAANYRLGPFGFWYHPDFEARMAEEHNLPFDPNLPYSGNQALMDQQMAMIWTREYSAYFGGSKDRITIGGMSAGGQSVNAHAVMPSSETLFDKVISFSGPNGVPYYNTSEAILTYESISANLDCCNEATETFGVCRGGVNKPCVMAKTSQEIQREAYKIRQLIPDWQRITMLIEPFHPTWDTALLEQMPYFMFSEGRIQDKPILVDTCDHEGYGFIPLVFQGIGSNVTVSEKRFEQLLNFLFQDDFDTVIQYYKCPCPTCECWEVADNFLTDFTWYCNMRDSLRKGYPKSSTRENPIYNVRLSQAFPGEEPWVEHGVGEHWFLQNVRREMSEDQKKWAAEYQNYLANFIRHGNPNNWEDNPNQKPVNEVMWNNWIKTQNAFDAGNNGTFGFGEQEIDPREQKCDMLDTIGHYMLH